MVSRIREWRFAALAVACIVTASLSSQHAAAQTGFAPPVPPGDIPQSGGMVWGGHVPSVGEGYRPSVARPDGIAATPPAAPEPLAATQPILRAAPAAPAAPAAAASSASTTSSLYQDLLGRRASVPAAAPLQPAGNGALPPLDAPRSVGGETSSAAPAADPWTGLKAVTAAPPPPRRDAPATPKIVPQRSVVASLGEARKPAPQSPVPGRGALENQTPSGYRAMPRSEAMCRTALRKMGVSFVDIDPVSSGKSCGIAHPVKITAIAKGVAMKPAATMNCAAAARISQWVEDEVKSAARWKLWKRPTAVLNASSYRCSRIAGSRTVSEHAKGNALDVRGFAFSDGSVVAVEKKGFFSFREKGFQKAVRHSACRYFGTVLGPGYNYDHRDHLHLDAKNRRRVVCK